MAAHLSRATILHVTATPKRFTASSAEILGLVKLALDEFDTIALDATVRRVVRIANMLGDSRTAVRLGLEVKASGGHPPANAAATRRLLADPSSWGDADGIAREAVEEYIEERSNSDGLVVSHSLAEIVFWQQELSEGGDQDTLAAEQYQSNLASRMTMNQILTRVRHHAFTSLCAYERQLGFATTQETALDALQWRVDGALNEHAPEILNQFIAAFRRLREARDLDADSAAAEELSQALTSCRRILKAVVDIVRPVVPGRPFSDEGHALGDDQYKNRLVDFLKDRVESSSFRTALMKGGETLFDRFSSIDSLTSKGVHASVAVEEAEYCALHTYLLAGEILAIYQGPLN